MIYLVSYPVSALISTKFHGILLWADSKEEAIKTALDLLHLEKNFFKREFIVKPLPKGETLVF